MSYPLHSAPRVSSSKNVYSETGFWGLDLAGCAENQAANRAEDTENLIWEGDALKVRSGYRKLWNLLKPIHGIYFYGNQQIIHAGGLLYRYQPGDEEPKIICSEIYSKPSRGIVRRQTMVRRTCNSNDANGWRRESITKDFLFINDGMNFLFYDGNTVRHVCDAHWGEDLRNLALTEGVEFYAAVPFVATGKLPDGTHGDADPRGDNRLSQFRCESFYVDDEGVADRFVLNCPFDIYNISAPPEIQIRDEYGVWRGISYSARDISENHFGRTLLTLKFSVKGGLSITLDAEGLISSFGVGDLNIANDGMDNVRITYAVLKEEPKALTGATVQGVFGADGSDDVLFLGGSTAAPGEDAFSAPNNFFCFYETSTERLGSAQYPVTGYCRLNDGRLAVLKNEPDGANVYFRSYQVLSVGSTQSGEAFQVEAYPSKMGAAVEGCVSPLSVGFAGNEPCFLAENGLYSVRSVSDELTNLNETVRRSIPIDPLLREQDPKSARCICWKGYYLLTFGKIGVITDGRKDSKGALRFLKWRFGHEITALAKKDDALYLGDWEGNVFLFGEGSTDGDLPMEAYWQARLPGDKTGRRQILKRLWAAISPAYRAKLKAVLYCGQCPAPPIQFWIHRLDFSDWDFGSVTFDGSRSMRWMSLVVCPITAEHFSIRFTLEPGADLLLWGLRMIYEKGGKMR